MRKINIFSSMPGLLKFPFVKVVITAAENPIDAAAFVSIHIFGHPKSIEICLTKLWTTHTGRWYTTYPSEKKKIVKWDDYSQYVEK